MNRFDFEKVNAFVRNPQRLALCVTKSLKNGEFNAITLEWFTKTSIKPPMFAVSIGNNRYSYKCLQNSTAFNLVIPSIQQLQSVKLFGSISGVSTNKFSLSKEPYFKGRYATLPIFKNSVAVFECQYVTMVKTGDHTLFVGEVKYSWLNNDKKILTLDYFKNS